MDLASEWAGFETVGQVEIADYPVKNVLEKHFPNVARWRDIREVTKESLDEKGVKDVTIVSGGFPCQPFSTAGLRKGKSDDRYLWPETLRVLGLIKPRWFVGENVAGLTSMASPEPLFEMESEENIKHYYERILAEIIGDLKKEGFLLPKCSDGTPIIFLVPACGVGAPHRRYRVFIIAYNDNVRWDKPGERKREGICGDKTCAETGTSNQFGSAPISHGERQLQQERVVEDEWGWPIYKSNRSAGNAPDPTGIQFRSESPAGENKTRLCDSGCNPSSNPAGLRERPGREEQKEDCGEWFFMEGSKERGNIVDFDGNGYSGDGSDSTDTEAARQRGDRGPVHSIPAPEGSHGHTPITPPGRSQWEEPWIKVATRFCGTSDGFSIELDGSGITPSRRNRLQRLKCLGNAVVPAQVYPFFEAIAKIEKARE